ncbi:MAG: EAL domain-containing protein, partial [Burkholderiales bacterium]|nr:EAL domain-containing protein [Burkholderiales bacterium]
MLLAAESLVRAHRITVLGRLHKAVTPAALAALLDPWVPHALGRTSVAKKVYPADEVRAAIANGELECHYQPKVVVASGAVAGVEALVRWRHPADGVVYPDQFIGVAEEHGLIGALTMAVLGTALTQARRWRDAGLALR